MRTDDTHRPTVLMIAYTNYHTDPRVVREAEAAVEAGYAVDFLALRREQDPPVEDVRGVRLIHLDQQRYRGRNAASYVLSYLTFFVRAFVRTSLLHARRRYRVVHVNNMPDFFVFCALVPKLLGARVILDIHDPMPDTFSSKFRDRAASWPYRLLLWQERLSAWFADQVITVHEPVKDHVLVAKHGMGPSTIEVIANFADDRLFALQPPRRLGSPLQLVFHGTILERYGLRTAMEAIASMKHRNRIRVLIIGEGDFSEQLLALIRDLGLGAIVDFKNRMFPLHDIPGMLAHCDLGLVPLEISAITNYAIPLKLLEYTSLGLPCVTVRNVAICHYFADSDCLFYDPGSPESLRAILDDAVERPHLLEAYRDRVRAMRDRLVWSGEKRRYQQLLHRLAGDAATAAKRAERIGR
jgi:glycosyltransferase involved in cell wall biosynthesis